MDFESMFGPAKSYPSWVKSVPPGSSCSLPPLPPSAGADADADAAAPAEGKSEDSCDSPAPPPVDMGFTGAHHTLLLISPPTLAASLSLLHAILRSTCKDVAISPTSTGRNTIGAYVYGEGGVRAIKNQGPTGIEDVKSIRNVMRDAELGTLGALDAGGATSASKRVTGSPYDPLSGGIMKSINALSHSGTKEISKPSPSSPPDTKSCWIVTSSPLPQEEAADSKLLKQRVRDGSDCGIDYRVIVLSDDNEFDDSGWRRLFDHSKDHSKVTRVTLSSLKAPASLESLPTIKRLMAPPRTLSTVPLLVSPSSPPVPCSIYRLCAPKRRPPTMLINASNNERLTTTGVHICKSTGKVVSKSEIETYAAHGAAKVKFTPEDVAELKLLSAGGEGSAMSVVGFKRSSDVDLFERLDNSFFVYPKSTRLSNGRGGFRKGSSSSSSGSDFSAPFVSLWKSCLSKSVVIIVRVVFRSPNVPRMSVLRPNVNGGFDGVLLPYKNDVRVLDEAPIDVR